MKTLVAEFAPYDSPRRKLLQLLAIVLVVEGLSVLALFSYAWIGLGLASVVMGAALLFLLYPGVKKGEIPAGETPGIRFTDWAMNLLGGGAGFAVLGASIIGVILLFNVAVSERPDIGDLDTIGILFGVLLIAYPLMSRRYRMEMSFALVFTGFVVVLLVLPQVIVSVSGGSGASSIGNWYVEYMLAGPFAGILDTMGIPASATGNMVSMQFADGSIHLLSISAYCAGLYSFSIFLSAFFSFVLVLENLRRRILVIVLALGLTTAYMGNLFRMVIIGVVGYHYGLEALLWTHENIGWMIFLSWSTLFWWLILRWTSRQKSVEEAEVESFSDSIRRE